MSTPMSTAEVAAVLGIDRSVVIRRVRAGRLTPRHKLPGHNGAYLFDRAEILALVDQKAAS